MIKIFNLNIILIIFCFCVINLNSSDWNAYNSWPRISIHKPLLVHPLGPVLHEPHVYRHDDHFHSVLPVIKVIKVPSLKLKDGYKIPMVGLGTDTISDEHSVRHLVDEALKIGYRHVDTAYIYKNEVYIGRKLRETFRRKENFITRGDVFLTSKLWSTFHSRFEAVESLLDSLKRLNTDYLDLFLVHYPFGFEEGAEDLPLDSNGMSRDSNISVVDTWKGLEDARKLGKVRSIGVANFNLDQLARIMLHAAVRPAVNMLEVNPYLSEECLVKYCQNSGIQVIAYNPLAKANQTLLNEPVLKRMANRYHKTVPQIIMRWLIQRNIAVIPEDKTRLIENLDLFDFELTKLQMRKIFRLNKDYRTDRFELAKFNAEYSFNNMCYE